MLVRTLQLERLVDSSYNYPKWDGVRNSMPERTDHLWQRLWRRLATTTSQSRTDQGARVEEPAVPLANLREIPSLVLLGSPGLGKSNEVHLAAREAISRGEAADVIPLGRLSGVDELESRILATARSSALKDKVWNLFLDGLDEALPQFTKDANGLSIALRSLAQVKNLSTVRLRISCRTAEWPRNLEADLQDLWGPSSVQLFELQELSEADVAIAASRFPPREAESFLAQIRKSEVEPLTERPVTLNMLLDVFERDARLPTQRVQLYREALLASLSEHNSRRRDSRVGPHVLLMIAARIAAATIFANSTEVWVGKVQQKSSGRAIAVSELTGGFEPTPDGSVSVGEAEVSQALHSSLFSSVGDSLFVWSHQSFSEFLAAYYLIERRLSSPKILELLRSSPDGRIAPQLREVSAWLASMDASFFSTLVEQEPDILLRSDIASASPKDREALVQALLLQFERSELHDFDFTTRARYDQLGHPHLGEQLTPFIKDRGKNIVARRVAIDIAEANEGAGLDDLLAETALDPGEVYHIRTQAAAALSKISNEPVRLRLRPLISGSDLDENDELKGYALRALWPQHISVRELLALLTSEKNSNFIGAYHFFLNQLEVPPLSEEDVPVVLDWILSTATSDERTREFDRAIPRFLDRIWDRAESGSVIRSLAEFFLKLVSTARYFSVQDVALEFFTRIGQSDKPRIALVREIVRTSRGDERLWLAAAYPARLVSYGDLPWLLKEVVSPTEDFPEDAAVQLILAVIGQKDVNDLDDVWDAAAKSPLLKRGLENKFSVDLASALVKFEREDYFRKKERAASAEKEKFDAENAINVRLDKIESDDAFGWWELNLVLLADERGMVRDEFSSDLTATKTWSGLSPSIRQRIVDAGIRYLAKPDPQGTSWLGANTFHRPAAAAYRAFRLLLTVDRSRFFELPAETWKVWGPSVLISFNTDDEASRQIIARRAYEMAPTTIRQAIERIVAKEESSFAVREVTRLFDHCYDDELGRFFWSVLRKIGPDRGADELIFYLASKGLPEIRQAVIRRMDGEPEEGVTIRTDQQFISGVSGLLAADARHMWKKFIAFRSRDEEMALDVIRAVAENSRFDNSLISQLENPDLADFFIWTYRRVPPRAESKGMKARWIGPDDQIEHLRNAALRRLVSLGTEEALSAVKRIAAELPEAPWLKYQVLDARRAVDAKNWQLREPAELIATIALHSPNSSPRSTKAAITSAATEELGEQAFVPRSIPDEGSFAESVELPPNPSASTPRRILAVATEWASGHGGISTFNRELCVALAELGHHVACFVLTASDKEVSDAKVDNVRLIVPPKDPGTSSDDIANLLLFYKEQLEPFEPEVVIGHDHITALAAHHIARRIYRVPYVHFVHTLPEEIEKYKTRGTGSLLRGGVKSGIQTRQCKLAQLVVAVGPRIYTDFYSRLGWAGTRVVELRPGLNRKLIKHKVDPTKPRRSDCLLVARLEDPVLKGAPLACQVITHLNSSFPWQPPSRRPKLILRGFTQDTFESELGAIDGMEAAKEFVTCRPYTPEEEDIAGDICAASVVIMPSKQEGFGLTALEAIAAGIPIAVTAESGLGEYLLTTKIAAVDAIAQKCVLDVIGEADDIAKKWSERIAYIFNNPEAAFEEAANLKRALMPVLTWELAARGLSIEIEAILEASAVIDENSP